MVKKQAADIVSEAKAAETAELNETLTEKGVTRKEIGCSFTGDAEVRLPDGLITAVFDINTPSPEGRAKSLGDLDLM